MHHELFVCFALRFLLCIVAFHAARQARGKNVFLIMVFDAITYSSRGLIRASTVPLSHLRCTHPRPSVCIHQQNIQENMHHVLNCPPITSTRNARRRLQAKRVSLVSQQINPTSRLSPSLDEVWPCLSACRVAARCRIKLEQGNFAIVSQIITESLTEPSSRWTLVLQGLLNSQMMAQKAKIYPMGSRFYIPVPRLFRENSCV
jgi:hypothetical protein